MDTGDLLALAEQEVRRGNRGPDFLTQNIGGETTGRNPANLVVKRTDDPGAVGVYFAGWAMRIRIAEWRRGLADYCRLVAGQAAANRITG